MDVVPFDHGSGLVVCAKCASHQLPARPRLSVVKKEVDFVKVCDECFAPNAPWNRFNQTTALRHSQKLSIYPPNSSKMTNRLQSKPSKQPKLSKQSKSARNVIQKTRSETSMLGGEGPLVESLRSQIADQSFEDDDEEYGDSFEDDDKLNVSRIGECHCDCPLFMKLIIIIMLSQSDRTTNLNVDWLTKERASPRFFTVNKDNVYFRGGMEST